MKKKKSYQQPIAECIELEIESLLQTQSPGTSIDPDDGKEDEVEV